MNALINLANTQNPKIEIDGRICHHRIIILFALTELYNLENYLEIGVHNGSSMSYVIQSKKNKICIGIDPFEDLVTDDANMIHYIKKDKITIKKTLENINKNNKHASNIKLIKKLSNNVTDKDISIDIDLLFIDGNHNFQAVLNDFNKFFKYVKKGGFIVFDDLHQPGPSKVFNKICKENKNIKLFGVYEKKEGILLKL